MPLLTTPRRPSPPFTALTAPHRPSQVMQQDEGYEGSWYAGTVTGYDPPLVVVRHDIAQHYTLHPLDPLAPPYTAPHTATPRYIPLGALR